MVFCKLSKEVTTKLNTAEKAIADGATTTKDTINGHISRHLAAIDKKKQSVYSRLQDKVEQQKRHIHQTIIQPHEERRRTNMAMMFYVDLSLVLVLSLFAYKMYPWLKRLYLGAAGANYTPEQYAAAMKLSESAYSREELRLAQEYRTSFQAWKDFYKAEDAFSEYNVGTTEIQRGSTLREPAKFMIQYVIPYVILAYVVWFLVKYIKYVIAAIWGFFVMMYQFVAKKITCKLAEKWYIRLGTGWSRCHPKFNQYVDEWQRNYVTRPVAQERITYLKGVQGVKTQYKAKFGEQPPHLTLWNRVWDWLYDWKRIYIDLPLQELYLLLIGFDPLRPYEILTDREQPYDSKTKSGKVCQCPPRKTLYRKLKTYMDTRQPLQPRLQGAAANLVATHAKVNQATAAAAATAASSVASVASAAASATTICDNNDDNNDNNKKTKKKNKKTLAKGIWVFFMLCTVGAVLYGLLLAPSSARALIKSNNEYINAGLALYAVFFVAGGAYSFLT